jgi:hypothetical protein
MTIEIEAGASQSQCSRTKKLMHQLSRVGSVAIAKLVFFRRLSRLI